MGHPKDRDGLLVPDKRTTFGVVEMTTGCGRRCQFCVPDLNPQIDVPKDRIMAGVHANVRDGNRQISLATEDMFIWGQVRTQTPFYFPNREALLDLYATIVTTPGVEEHVLSHATIAPAVVDPVLIRKLSELLLDKSPIRLPVLSSHPRSARWFRSSDSKRARHGWPGRSCRARACPLRSTTGRAWSSMAWRF